MHAGCWRVAELPPSSIHAAAPPSSSRISATGPQAVGSHLSAAFEGSAPTAFGGHCSANDSRRHRQRAALTSVSHAVCCSASAAVGGSWAICRPCHRCRQVACITEHISEANCAFIQGVILAALHRHGVTSPNIMPLTAHRKWQTLQSMCPCRIMSVEVLHSP
jgi:hypothetical protein